MTLTRLSRLTTRLASSTGLSLAEITVILSVASVLGATLTPAVGDYVHDARLTKAQDDARVLANAMARFAFDVGRGAGDPLASTTLMVGPGAIPALGDGGDAAWVLPGTDDHVAFLDDHLMTNTAGHARRASARTFRTGWNGPYVGVSIDPDPWGRRYAVNIGPQAGVPQAVIVLSAGKNGVVETPFDSAYPKPGGDDIVALVTAGGL